MSSFNFIKFLLLAKPIFAQLPISFGLGQLSYMGGEGLQRYHVRDSGTFPWKKLMCGFGTLGQIYLRFIFMITEHCQELLQQICSWYFFSWSLNSIRDYWSRFTHDIFMITERGQENSGQFESVIPWCAVCRFALYVLPCQVETPTMWPMTSPLTWPWSTALLGISYPLLAWLTALPVVDMGDCTACCWHGWLHCPLLTWVTELPVVDIGDRTACCLHGWLECLVLT